MNTTHAIQSNLTKNQKINRIKHKKFEPWRKAMGPKGTEPWAAEEPGRGSHRESWAWETLAAKAWSRGR